MSKSFKDLQRSMVAFNRGSGPAVRENTRDAFFGGRDDVSADRLAKRAFQEQRLTDFKNKFTKPVNIVDSEGNVTGVVKGLTQMTDDAPRSLVAETERLANMYGPTLSELGGDFMRGLGSLTKNISPISFIPGANALIGGVNTIKDIFFPDPPVVTTGGSVTGSVTEEPLSSGVIDVLPNNFIPVVKTKPDLPMGDRLRTMDMMYDFYNLPIDQPELYG